MNIEYGCVARETIILCQCALLSGNYDVTINDILTRIDKDATRSTYDQNRVRFFILSDNQGLNFVIAGPSSIRSDDAFSLLNDLKRRFMVHFAKDWKNAIAYQMQTSFESELRTILQSKSKIKQIQENLNETQTIMSDNLHKALTRGSELDVLEAESGKLSEYSHAFSREAGKVKRQMLWEKYKWYLFILIALLLVIYMIVAIACKGLAFQGCRKQNDQTNSSNTSNSFLL